MTKLPTLFAVMVCEPNVIDGAAVVARLTVLVPMTRMEEPEGRSAMGVSGYGNGWATGDRGLRTDCDGRRRWI